MKAIYKLGTLMMHGLNLQFYFLVKLLQGGIVLGFFPAILSVYRLIQRALVEDAPPAFKFREAANKFDKREFLVMNVLGFGFTVVFLLLWLNLRISAEVIRNWFFHGLTLLIMAILISTFLHMIPVIGKYELPIRQYILQGFLCSIVGFFETLAIIVGMAFAAGIGLLVPPVGFFMGVPLIIFPHVWFSRHSIRRLESIFYKGN
ncbi:MAG: DUF624 domain-containing protein [Turicibacter sp.]|nr:DUF624 domain-containing protein [Turicibacter sp.]